jgi:hypothetical protein
MLAVARIEPPTSSCDLTFPQTVHVARRAVRRDAAAPADCHPAVGLGEVVVVELNAQLGGVK